MLTAEWVSATAAVISIPISIWTIVSVKRLQQKIGGIHLKNSFVQDNNVQGSGSIISNKG